CTLREDAVRLCLPGRPRAGRGRARAGLRRAERRESRPRALEDEFAEQADADRGGALGLVRRLALRVRGPRDVEMHPGVSIGELAQEPAAGDCPGPPAARVLHVGYVGLEEVPVLVPQWQRPAALA